MMENEPMEKRMTEVEKVCDDLRAGQAEISFNLKGVEETSKETARSVEKILTNHLPHIQAKLDMTIKVVSWTLGITALGIAVIGILVSIH